MEKSFFFFLRGPTWGMLFTLDLAMTFLTFRSDWFPYVAFMSGKPAKAHAHLSQWCWLANFSWRLVLYLSIRSYWLNWDFITLSLELGNKVLRASNHCFSWINTFIDPVIVDTDEHLFPMVKEVNSAGSHRGCSDPYLMFCISSFCQLAEKPGTFREKKGGKKNPSMCGFLLCLDQKCLLIVANKIKKKHPLVSSFKVYLWGDLLIYSFCLCVSQHQQ